MPQHRHLHEQLTRREREIVNALFALGNRASAEEIRSRLSSPPSDSSVRVMLARLQRKGVLKHQAEGLKYLYSTTTPPAVAKKTALQQYLQTFFAGSLTRMMTALVAESSFSEDELDALKTEIERIRKDKERKTP
jgi:BlaI family transcriptional regulator, penicillinase repressor